MTMMGIQNMTFFVLRKRFQRGSAFEPSQLVMHALLLAAAFLTLMPFYWMVVTSFRAPEEIFAPVFHWLPSEWIGFANYEAALSKAPFLKYLANGVIVCSGILAVQLLVAIPAAWALARFDFKGKPLLFATILLGLTIPIQAPAIPLFIGLAELELLDSYFALMLPFFLSVFAIFLFRQALRQFPEDIVEAARLDGMSEFEILWRVVVPAMRPAIAAFAIFSVVAHWNDLYWPLIVVTNPDLITPPLGMAQFSDPETGTNFGALMAAATMLTLPILGLFLFLQREFMLSVTASGTK